MSEPLCALCGGNTYIVEEDLEAAVFPELLEVLFEEGRTEICPRCKGTGLEPRRAASFGWGGWLIFWLLMFLAGALGWLLWTGAF